MASARLTIIRSFQSWGILLGVPALFVLAALLPQITNFPLCGVKHFLGFDCPGCGLTHSIVALVHGHIRTSIAWHPLGIVIAVWLIYMFGRSVVTLVIGREPPELLTQRGRDWVLTAFLIALFLQWGVKLLATHGVTQTKWGF